MSSKLGHLQVMINPDNIGFYRDLFTAQGWTTIHDGDGMIGLRDANDSSVWFGGYDNNGAKNDYDGIGVNHIAFHTEKQSDVDATVAYLGKHHIEALFETPRHRPDFGMGDGQTYYQVMFKTPDNLLFEFVYIGPMQS